jgi:hypothetical protein
MSQVQEIRTRVRVGFSGGSSPRSQSPCASLQKHLFLTACRMGGIDDIGSTSLGRLSAPIRARRSEFRAP